MLYAEPRKNKMYTIVALKWAKPNKHNQTKTNKENKQKKGNKYF